MNVPKRLLLSVVIPIVMVAVTAAATAQPAPVVLLDREAELKGKVVGVLGGLVKWPGADAPGAGRPLKVGIVGTSPFVDDGVDHLQAKVPTAIISNFKDATAIKSCHILFVARDADFASALAKVKGQPVLVVGESSGLAKQGAAMNLVFNGQLNTPIRLEINPKTAADAGLTIDRRLLSVPFVDIIR